MNNTDSCPNCTRTGIHPNSEHNAGNQTTSRYRCPRCRTTWTTSRLATAYRPSRSRRRPAA